MKKSNKEDSLEEIGVEYRELIKTIMKECNVNAELAFQKLAFNDFIVQKAIKQINSSNRFVKGRNNNNNYGQQNEMYFEDDEDDSDDQYLVYHYFRTDQRETKYFYQRYPIDIRNLGKNQKKNSINENDDILFSKLSERIQNNQKLAKNEYESLEKAFCTSYRDHLPVLIFATNLEPDVFDNIKKLFKSSNLQLKLRTQFVYFGIYKDMYSLEQWLEPYFKINQYMNCIMIFRVNLYDEITVVDNISLKQSTQSILNGIKRAKATCIKLNLDENYIRVKQRMAAQGKYFKRPNNLQQRSKRKAEQKKLLSNQKLRRQQEEIYHQVHSNLDQNNTKDIKISQLKEKSKSKQQILGRRAETRKIMKIYQEGVSFKIRAPSGISLFLIASKTQKIKYIFDFVESRQENLGFEDQLKRIFDLNIGFGDSRSLLQKKQQQIHTLFEQSAFLVIRQIS